MPRDSYYIKLVQLTGRVVEDPANSTQLVPQQQTNCFSGPTILSFSGNEAHDQKEARGFAKRATRLAGVYGYHEVGVYGGYYVGETNADYVRTYNLNHRWPENYGTGAQKFTKHYLQLLVTDPEGNRLSNFQAKKNLRNLNILVTSFGGIAIEEIGNCLVDHMEQRGFSKEDIEEITRQVVVVSIGTRAMLGKGKAGFTRVSLFNKYDMYLYDESAYASPMDTNGTSLNRELHYADRNGSEISVISCSPCETIIGVNYDLSEYARFNRERTFFKRRPDGIGWTESYYLKDSRNHNPDLYLVPGIGVEGRKGKYGFFIPALISNVLSGAVSNSLKNANDPNVFHELPRIEELLVDTKSRPQNTATRELLTTYSNQNSSFRSRVARSLVAPLSLS